MAAMDRGQGTVRALVPLTSSRAGASPADGSKLSWRQPLYKYGNASEHAQLIIILQWLESVHFVEHFRNYLYSLTLTT